MNKLSKERILLSVLLLFIGLLISVPVVNKYIHLHNYFVCFVFNLPYEGASLLRLQEVIVCFVCRNQISPYNGAGILSELLCVKLLIQQMAGAKVLQKLCKIFL